MDVSLEKSWKRLVFRWTAPRGVAAMALFFALVFFMEYLVVRLFRSYGLADTQTFQVSFSILTLTISPLFHLIPLGVIAVLVSSWTYLTKHMAKVPHRAPVKKTLAKPRKPAKKGKKRFRAIRGFSRRVSRRFRKVTQALRALCHQTRTSILRIRGVSPIMERSSFARAAARSTATVLLIFLVSFLTLNLMGYPTLIHDLVVGLYRSNPSFHRFVIGTIETAGAIGQVLSPIGHLASTVNQALISTSSGFRSTLEGFVLYATEPLAELDPIWRYTLCQNIAAWISAIAALGYGEYTSRLYRRYRR